MIAYFIYILALRLVYSRNSQLDTHPTRHRGIVSVHIWQVYRIEVVCCPTDVTRVGSLGTSS